MAAASRSADDLIGDSISGHKRKIICGTSAADGKVACGIPMYRDPETDAPYILPIYVSQRTPKPKQNLACGMSADGGGFACGMPVFNDQETQIPVVLPMFGRPPYRPPVDPYLPYGVPPSYLQEAHDSMMLRKDALDLLRRFLDASDNDAVPLAPDTTIGPGSLGSGLAYPVPSKKVPGGVQVVSTGAAALTPVVAGPGSFL